MTQRKFTHPDKAPGGQEYETECGCPARIYSTDTGKGGHIHGAYWSERDSKWYPMSWYWDGRSYVYNLNLRDKPRKIKGWVNVYPERVGAHLYSTKEHADRCADPRRIACIPIEYTEGEGLE